MRAEIKGEGAMRFGTFRAFAGGVLLLGAAGLASGCGLLGSDNSGAVCADTKAAFQQYMTQVRAVSAARPAEWTAPTQQLAGRVGALAAKAEDAKLKSALKDEAARLQAASATIGKGDAAQLDKVMSDTPKRIGAACD
ncbi:hypothetical protein [Actinomadura parmotrematis]|uniref:Lipoprotein n=1 Tax=Actinomadura parmotrematis TaxID=2864039 RepID=A0ABS7G3P1_9ACTN|nr:hypothetical protein [Actinomadura parmotrematis]MBW8486432.1 hypothetical protein [Actinomadura parmotrematis]